MTLSKLKRTSDTELSLTWSGGETTIVSLQRLRDECPCAGCKGETVLFEHYAPVKLPIATPGMYDLKSVGIVGNYSLQPVWGDGHSTGLYAFDYLYELSKKF